MGIFDSIDKMTESSNASIWGIYTKEEKNKIEEWNKLLGQDDALSFTVFRDAEFLRSFLKKIPEEEQFNYVKNTYKYGYSKQKDYDSKYVIFTRRSVPSNEPKPESFWTSEHREVLSGLKEELPPNSPQRTHSVIMVTSLDKLEEHGIIASEGGASDGEIIIDNNKPFNSFLFDYKPEREQAELQRYLANGGMTREEVLEKIKSTAKERAEAQGITNDSFIQSIQGQCATDSEFAIYVENEGTKDTISEQDLEWD